MARNISHYGRILGEFELDGHRFHVVRTVKGVTVSVFLDDIEHGPLVAKVYRPDSPKRHITVEQPWRPNPHQWHAAFKREVTRICREDVHRPDAEPEGTDAR